MKGEQTRVAPAFIGEYLFCGFPWHRHAGSRKYLQVSAQEHDATTMKARSHVCFGKWRGRGNSCESFQCSVLVSARRIRRSRWVCKARCSDYWMRQVVAIQDSESAYALWFVQSSRQTGIFSDVELLSQIKTLSYNTFFVVSTASSIVLRAVYWPKGRRPSTHVLRSVPCHLSSAPRPSLGVYGWFWTWVGSDGLPFVFMAVSP